jgi:AmmeMemoRadiSam system protein B
MTPPEPVIRSRLPAVAGLFYPEDPYELRAVVRGYLDAADATAEGRPKALIVPHAGYVYSGPVAASAYRALVGLAGSIERVVLAGPSHRVPVPGIAVPEVAAFDTPLGRIPIDTATVRGLLAMPEVYASNLPHRMEHSLEVQLPFLQMTLEDFSLVPLAVGDADPALVDRVLEACWGGAETLVVISSDLSHYRDYESARRIDAATARALVERTDGLHDEQACGCRVLNGLMRVARRHQLRVETLDLRNSGDTSGDTSRVVGYGAFALYGD